jgi:hypothetical protein
MHTSFAKAEASKVSLTTRRNSALVKLKLLAHGVQDAPQLFDLLPRYTVAEGVPT